MNRIAIVEDDRTLVEHYRAIIEAEPDMELVASAHTLREGLDMLRWADPDVLLCDLGLPDGSGIDIVRQAFARNPRLHVLVVTLFSDNEHVFSAIKAGAAGYLLKDALPDSFAASIREVASGGSPINAGIARRLLGAFRDAPPAPDRAPSGEANPLSARETEILELMAKGLSFGDVAELLAISGHTVTTHVRKIYQKLAVNSRAEAVYEARQMGIIG